MIKYPKMECLFERGDDKKLTNKFANDYFRMLQNAEWIANEKIDGTNVRIDTHGNYKGRTDNAKFTDTQKEALQKVAHIINVAHHMHQEPVKIFSEFPYNYPDLIYFGELCGPKIQKDGHLYGDEQRFVLFDVWTGARWLEQSQVRLMADQLGLLYAPSCDEDLNISDWIYYLAHPIQNNIDLITRLPGAHGREIEGLVLRPKKELTTAQGKRIIAKLRYVDIEALRADGLSVSSVK